MRRIKKRNLNTIRIKRDAYVGNVKDEEEVIVEETVDITPERVTMEEKAEPVCADVAADVENSVEEAETEAEAAEEKAEADVAEETVAEEIGEADVAEEVEVAEETAPAEEVEVAEETAPVEEVESVEEPVAEEIAEETAEPAEEVVEDTVTVTPDEVVFDEEEKLVAESEETDVEEAVLEAEAEETETAEAAEDTADAVEEVTEEVEEVPLEASEEESEEILDEEGSLDGTEEEVKELAQAEETEIGEPEAEAVEETAEKVETEEVEEPEAEAVEETATEETETAEEENPAEKTEKEVFKLTTPANQDDILSRICVKRGRKLIYRPNEIIFNCTAAVTGTDKNNEEGIKIKSILDEEIKQGVKLGYIDKYDGLKMSEIKEEYENDVVYEYAEQEFKRVGLVLDGEKVKVYVYDWDMKALHHIGFVDQANVADLKPYLEDKEKYSFDVCGLITGGKFRKVIKDEATGKVTVEKGNDGKLGVELDISIINRKD